MARRSTNAFGEAWQGSKIQGAGSLARARGYAYGALTSQQRGEFGSQANFQAAAEQAEQREERLKKKGREEVELEAWLKAQAKADKAADDEAKRQPNNAARLLAWADGLRLDDEAKRQQNKYKAPSMGGRWSDGVDIPGMGNVAADTRPSPLQPAKPRVNYNTPTPSAEALRKLRRAINRREQRPGLLSSGQPNRSNW